jgi:hypothetical protein
MLSARSLFCSIYLLSLGALLKGEVVVPIQIKSEHAWP